MSEPAAVAETITLQDAETPDPCRVQAMVDVNVTVPDGVDWAPASVSVTIAVQVAAWLTVTVEGSHATAVEVARLFTIMELLAPRLPEWTVSPA